MANLDIFNQPDSSGKFSKEKWVLNNYPDEYDIVINFCNDNHLLDLPFKQKVYHTINNIKDIVLCKNPNCDKPVKYRNSSLGYRDYCSNKCIGNDPNIIKKKEQTNLNKFGVKHAILNESIKNKSKESIASRTNKDKELSNAKRKETVLSKYGVDSVAKIPEVIEKRVESFKENIEQWKENYRETSLDKYGVEHPWMNKDIHDKTIKVFYDQYKDRIVKKLKEISSNDIFINFEKNIGKNTDLILECNSCNQQYQINDYNFYFRSNNKNTLCTLCNPIGLSYKSDLELQLLKFVKENYNNKINDNDRDVIPPYELDIYLPNDKIAIEFNGIFWHSEMNKPKDYHLIKTKMCEKLGIHLIHIWEDDWVYKNEIVKSIILNKLNSTSNKIYARNCDIRIVSSEDNKSFLNDNHIQGFSGASIRLGLYHNNDLISLMTFGKLRPALGGSPKENHYELIRFCNKKYTNIIGGASKLFKYFINNYNPENIVSYSDRSIFDGSLYEKLGFNKIHESKIGYQWVIDKVRHHRYNWRKSSLVKRGYDINKSEREIMYEDIGAYRVWDCGVIRWEWIK